VQNEPISPESPPRLDEAAPYFEGRSTQGPVKLTDFAGRWLLFFAHPADFTPVCTSEFVSFAKHSAQFAALNCKLLGLSVDSVYAHLAWLESIREHFGVDIDFPLLEDVSMEIARRYGMIQPRNARNAAVRALFVIDPAGKMRAMLYYPVDVGRSVAEVLRLVQALQTADRLQIVTPEGWVPGEEAVERPPETVAAINARRDRAEDGSRAEGYGCVDWYYYKRPAGELTDPDAQ
jgi:peroxiredoxin (alkyl hydroperoxide reductase subunit C)